MYVLHGPVKASGYEWYDVLPLDARYHDQRGWVASADKSGEPWIVPATPTCPKLPTTVTELASMTQGARLACFSRVSITVPAQLVDVADDVNPGYEWDPAWFGRDSILLENPTVAGAAAARNSVVLILDPAAMTPDPLPVHVVVQVTGMFDHPAARSCTATSSSPWEVFRDLCRPMFVVTEIHD